MKYASVKEEGKNENPGNALLFTRIHIPGCEQRHPAQTGLINRGVKQMTNLLIIEIYRTILINKDCWE